jgi:hypothetical protein
MFQFEPKTMGSLLVALSPQVAQTLPTDSQPAILELSTDPQTERASVLQERSTFAPMEHPILPVGSLLSAADGKILVAIAILRTRSIKPSDYRADRRNNRVDVA